MFKNWKKIGVRPIIRKNSARLRRARVTRYTH